MTLQSHLNEPFNATVSLLNTEGLDASQVKIRLASPDDFSRAGVDRAYFLVGLKFEVQLDENGGGKHQPRDLKKTNEMFSFHPH